MTRSRESNEALERLRARAEAFVRMSREDVRARPADEIQRLVHELQVHQIELQMQNEELVATQASLEASRERYRELYDQAPVGYVTLDHDSTIREVNACGAVLLGASKEELVGTHLSRLVCPEDLLEFMSFTARSVASDRAGLRRFRFVGASGTRSWMQFIGLPAENSDPPQCRVALIDVTALHEAEERHAKAEDRLHEAEKLEGIGRFAGGVAHNFNNALMAIVAGAESAMLALDRRPAGVASARRHMDRIVASCDAVAALVRGLMTFSHPEDLRFEIVDLDRLLDRVDQHLATSVPGNVRYESTRSGEGLKIRTNATRLEQTIADLAKNACEAMPDGGRLVLDCSREAVDQEPATGNGSAEPLDVVVIEIRDSGRGIAEGDEGRIFEPFYTTKAVGEGVGLGLSTAYALVQASGGRITVTRPSGIGCSVRLAFPAVREGPSVHLEREGRTPGTTKREPASILLCDDERSIRELLASFLESRGYAVVQAGDGRAALRLAEHAEVPFDLLVTDLAMPEMRGDELARTIVVSYPATRVLIITGHPGSAIAHDGDDEKNWRVLEKPFGLARFGDEIESLLDR